MADYNLQYQDTYIDALLATANELKTAGYIYKGVATPTTNPGTPTERVAYLAAEPGTYTNFGSVVVDNGLYALLYDGSAWTGTQMQVGSDIDVDELNSILYSTEVVALGGLTKALGTMNANGGWTKVTSASKVRSIFIPVTPGEKYTISQGSSSGSQFYAVLDTLFTTTSDQSASNIDYATGYTGRIEIAAGNSATIEIPSDGHYIVVRADNSGGGSFAPSLIHIVRLNSRVNQLESVASVKHYVTEVPYFAAYSFSIVSNVVSYSATANWRSVIIPVADIISVSLLGTEASYSTHVPPVVFLRGAEPTQANWIQGSEMYGSVTEGQLRRLTTSSFFIPAEATHVLLQNNNATSTNAYVEAYDIDYLRSTLTKLAARVVTVDANGNGNYTTIADAITGTSDGDTIMVYPGTYEESVHAFDKERHIIGVCRDTCILTNGTGAYATPPLEMSIGSIENMTIIADNYDATGDPTTEHIQTDYAIHVEYPHSTAYQMAIRNCTIISKWNAAIGAGVRYNQTLIVENCDIKSECVQVWSSYEEEYKQIGAVFFHNDAVESNSNTGHFILRNCRLRGVNHALSLSPQSNRPYLEVEYINNNLCTSNNGVTNIIDNWHPSVTGRITKSVACYGNNIAELNA